MDRQLGWPRSLSQIGKDTGGAALKPGESHLTDPEKDRVRVERDDARLGETSEYAHSQRSGAGSKVEDSKRTVEVVSEGPENPVRPARAGRIDRLGEHRVPPIQEPFA